MCLIGWKSCRESESGRTSITSLLIKRGISLHFHLPFSEKKKLKWRQSVLNLAKMLEIGKSEKVNTMAVLPAMSVACIGRLGFLYWLWKRKALSPSDDFEYLSKSYPHLIFLARICRLLWIIASKSEKKSAFWAILVFS